MLICTPLNLKSFLFIHSCVQTTCNLSLSQFSGTFSLAERPPAAFARVLATVDDDRSDVVFERLITNRAGDTPLETVLFQAQERQVGLRQIFRYGPREPIRLKRRSCQVLHPDHHV